MIIGYGKLGRSMPLTLEACGTLGGDIEMTATLVAMAKRRPQDTFVLVGRNSGHDPKLVGLPSNIVNPWLEWGPQIRDFTRSIRQSSEPGVSLTIEQQQKIVSFMRQLTHEQFMDLDEMVMWIGQHGTTNSPIPKVSDRSVLTKPYDWSIFYASYMLHGINAWRDVNPFIREEISLNADPRNYHKMRDLKWPLCYPILTQYDFTSNLKHERYGDYTGLGMSAMADRSNPDVWESRVRNVYSRIELNALVPGTPSGDLVRYNDEWSGRDPFGIVINEARVIGIREEMTRLHAMKHWVVDLNPAWVYGTWSARSTEVLQQHGFKTPIKSLGWENYIPTIQTVLSTFTTPSSGSHWATTKPWEAFGAGVVCFFHPEYDKQNHILHDAPKWLQDWLRVKTPTELKERVAHLATVAGSSTWRTIVDAQRKHFYKSMQNPQYLQMIDDRLDHAQKG